MMNALRSLAALVLFPTLCTAAFPTLFLKNVCDDQIHAPTVITNAGDGSGRVFICDQPGKIYIFNEGMLLPTPFLDVGPEMVSFGGTYSERGLLGLCFHPGFENEASPGYRRFYVNYTAPNTHPTLNPVTGNLATTDCVTVIAEYQVSLTNPNIADPTTKRIVITYGQPQSNHNGGQLEFGPDGLLYIAVGDGGGANDNQVGHTEGSGTSSVRVSGSLGNGQDRRTLLGKILRIDPLGTNGPGGSYGIPASNPFVGLFQDFVDPALDGPMRGEIYAYGMRNPWKFSFDSQFGGSQKLICADVGQVNVEELDFIVSGGNYGWRIKEGTVDFDLPNAYLPSPNGIGLPGLIAPFAQYSHPTALPQHGTLPGTETMPRLGASITGGYVYRGNDIPELQGKYLCADYAVNGIGGGNGILIGVEETSPGVFSAPAQILTYNALPAGSRIYTFGVNEGGEMLMGTKTTSGVLALSGGKPAGTIWKIMPVTSTSVNIGASRDNSMYSEGTNSNGKGEHLFAGKTGDAGGQSLRRALLRFDVSSIPAAAVVTSAAVTLTVTKQVSQDIPMKLHKVTADWGEGNSNAGDPGGIGATPLVNDATWIRRFHNTVSWATPGGDFVSSPSSTTSVGNALFDPPPTWSGAGIVADIQAWRTTPANNFGWILIGDETSPYSAMRFGSRENLTSADRPRLSINYSIAPQPTAYEVWSAIHFPSSPPGTYLDPRGDLDGDGIFNQIEYAYGFSPLVYNTATSSQFSTLVQANENDGTDFTVTFRRDSSATDLTYQLQTSDNLIDWVTIARSIAGTTTFGDNTGNVISDEAVSGTIRLVTVRENLPAGSNEKRFVRLQVLRNP